MTTTTTVRLSAGAVSCTSVRTSRRATASNSPVRAGRTPVSIPRSQAYYWTERWQMGEARAMEQLRRGEFQEFESGPDAVRWLLIGD